MECWTTAREELESAFAERITLDALTGPNGRLEDEQCVDDAGHPCSWLIAQRKKGHRHSIDDVLTAWYALQCSPQVDSHLDLGTGIGTVGLLTLWGMGRAASLTCVEAQDISYRLLQTNLLANALQGRVHAIQNDLRDYRAERHFPLVTGSPPYFPTSAGIVPADSQKAHARFELRGDVSDYAKAAFRHLAPDGWFVLCFPSSQRQRALDGIEAAGLKVVRLREVIPRETLAPLFDLIACRHPQEAPREMEVERPLVVRHEDGSLTAEMAGVRRTFGFRDGEAHGGHF